MTRAEMDQLAWQLIHSRKPQDPAMGRDSRPANYRELGEWLAAGAEFEIAWSEFKHAFYHFKTCSFFSSRPPALLSVERQALLAGAAEFFCLEFCLAIPAWANEPRYSLATLWDAAEDFFPYPNLQAFREERLRRAHPVFLARNILFESRSLIAL